MANEWYVLVGDKEYGPLSDQQLRSIAAKQQINQSTPVRKGKDGNWGVASRIRGLIEESQEVSVQATTKIVRVAQSSRAAAGPPTKAAPDSEPSETRAPKKKRRRLPSCPDCGKRISPNAASCPNCGYTFFRPNRSVAIALAWLLGGIGIHKFYLRKPGDGIAALLFCWTFIPAIVAFVEGFQYLLMDDATFARKFGSGVGEDSADRAASEIRAETAHKSREPIDYARMWKGIGKWSLAVIGGFLVAVAPVGIIEEPHRWMTSVLFAIIGICLFPFGWTIVAAEFSFVKQYGTYCRWIVGMLALLTIAIVDSESGSRSQTSSTEWYDRGMLLDRSALDWQLANNEDKLASCGGLLASLVDENSLKPQLRKTLRTRDDLRPLAKELAGLIDAATPKIPTDELNWKANANRSVREIAMASLLAKGHLVQPTATNAATPSSTRSKPSFEITEQKVLPGNRKSFIITLQRRIPEDALREIAVNLRDSDPNSYQLVHIAFYLGDMKVGTGAWAIAEFDPDLEIRMLGLNVEQEQAISALPTDTTRQVIGSWWDERPILKNKMTYFRQNGKVLMENKFDDGTARVVEMREVSSAAGRRYTYVPDNGDYFVINASGALEWWDEDGHFLTSRKAN